MKDFSWENISILPFSKKRKVGSYYRINNYTLVITDVRQDLEVIKHGMNHWLYDLKVVRPLNLIDRLMKYIDNKKTYWYLR